MRTALWSELFPGPASTVGH